MALWEAPMTAIVNSSSREKTCLRCEGLRAGSSSSCLNPVTGRGPMIGLEPVHRTRSLEDMVNGSDVFSSEGSMLTVHFSDYFC